MIFKLWSHLLRKFVDVPSQCVDEFYAEHTLVRTSDERKESPMLGSLLIKLWDGETGNIKAVRCLHNLITTAGKGFAIDRFQGTSVPVADYIAIGTGTNAAALGDTALQTEIGTRVQGALTQPDATTDRCISTFAAGNGTGAITEAGRLTASSGGVLVGRTVFSVVNKAAGDPLTVQYDLTT